MINKKSILTRSGAVAKRKITKVHMVSLEVAVALIYAPLVEANFTITAACVPSIGPYARMMQQIVSSARDAIIRFWRHNECKNRPTHSY